jgi:hypothetical protein
MADAVIAAPDAVARIGPNGVALNSSTLKRLTMTAGGKQQRRTFAFAVKRSPDRIS